MKYAAAVVAFVVVVTMAVTSLPPVQAASVCQAASGDPIPTETITFNFSNGFSPEDGFGFQAIMPVERDGSASVFGWAIVGRTQFVFTGQSANASCEDADNDGVAGLAQASFTGRNLKTGDSVRVQVRSARGDIDTLRPQPVSILIDGQRFSATASRIPIPGPR